jgi:hypothetical protein
MVLGGNPTQISGTFYDAFHKSRAFYTTLTLSSELSAHVTPDYCARIAAKYGRESDFYRVRVLGEFPRAEPDVFIRLDLVEKAIVREEVSTAGTVAIGCDPARFGDAESVIYWREGYKVHEPEVLLGVDTGWTAGAIARLARRIHGELRYEPRVDVMIDETGLGAGVIDALTPQETTLWINVVPVSFGGAGSDECYDAATLLMWGIREALPLLQLPDDDDTVAQLTTRRYRVMPDGRVKIESKDDLRRRGLPSPDRADALGLAFYQERNRDIISASTREALAARRARR